MDTNLLLITIAVMVHVRMILDYYYLILCYVDIPNCLINDHNCSHVCVEVEGSFNCSCYPGYESQQDGVTCTGINTYAMLLL